MNNTQIMYVKKRIEEIYSENKAKIRAKYIWIAPKLNYEQKIDLIKQGKYTIKQSSWKDSLDSVLSFAEQENPNLKVEAEAYAALNTERTRLLDELVLGDVEEALALLNNFAKKEF